LEHPKATGGSDQIDSIEDVQCREPIADFVAGNLEGPLNAEIDLKYIGQRF
jgi:hypothetical protein